MRDKWLKPENLAKLRLDEEVIILKMRVNDLEKFCKTWNPSTKKGETKRQIDRVEEVFIVIKEYMIGKVEYSIAKNKNLRTSLVKEDTNYKIKRDFDISLMETMAVLKSRISSFEKFARDFMPEREFQVKHQIGSVEVILKEIKKHLTGF